MTDMRRNNSMTLPELRLGFVQARDQLRRAKDDLGAAAAMATFHTVGANERERKKADDQALIDDGTYQQALRHLRACEMKVEDYEALIDGLRDERTARELSIRERNNEVLDRLAAAYEALARTNPVRAAIDSHLPF